MQSNKLNQILKNRAVWNTAMNPQIRNITQALYRNNGWYWSCPSRTLQNVLHSTVNGYYGGSGEIYRYLATMCSVLDNNKPIKIYPKYKLISSEQAPDLATNLIQLLDMPAADPNAFNLYLYHIPKGKSYLRKVLDENTDLIRLKQIETLCIENTQHFIRVYRNFNNTENNSVTIFSDQYSTDLINTLFVMLPHLMGIVSREATEEYELTEADKKYNQQVQLLFDYFGILYGIMQEGQHNMHTCTDHELSVLAITLSNAATAFANTFDFKTAQLDSFTKRLAKARNDNAQRYYTNKLSSINSLIRDYENTLKRYYADQAKYQRELIAHKLISEDDVKPFTETIKNTKAIEILSSSETEMVVRVTAPVQYFQESDFTAYEGNPSSTYMRNFYNNPTFRQVLHKVFVTREYKLLMQGIIHIQIQENYDSSPLYVFCERSLQAYYKYTEFPNPHLFHHDCWGPAKTEMQKNMCEGNFELVIMQMVAAVQSINIAENASFVNGLLYDIQNNTNIRTLMTFIVETPEGPKTFSYDEILIYERNLGKQVAVEQAKETIAQTPKGTYTQVELPDNDEDWNNENYPNFDNEEDDENEEN